MKRRVGGPRAKVGFRAAAGPELLVGAAAPLALDIVTFNTHGAIDKSGAVQQAVGPYLRAQTPSFACFQELFFVGERLALDAQLMGPNIVREALGDIEIARSNDGTYSTRIATIPTGAFGGAGAGIAGYTWDTLLTVSIPRGFELGARLDVLHCPACEHKVDGAALLGSALVTAWKDDLSAITFYLGPAVGFGYSAETDKPFLELELQAAVQFRLIFDGLWIRPMLFAGAGGAYDGYTSLGLRLAVGYAVNHGQRPLPDTTPPVLPHVPGACGPPPSADVAASAVSWIVPNCFRKNASAHLGGIDVPVSDHAGDLEIRVGTAAPGATQQVEIFVGGGSFPVQLRRP